MSHLIRCGSLGETGVGEAILHATIRPDDATRFIVGLNDEPWVSHAPIFPMNGDGGIPISTGSVKMGWVADLPLWLAANDAPRGQEPKIRPMKLVPIAIKMKNQLLIQAMNTVPLA